LRTILLATSLFLCAIKALAQTPSQPPPGVNVERVLVIGTKDAPPFAMKDDRGDWTGLSIDLWKHIAEQLHLSYRFKETTLQGLIDETASGELDGAITALTVTAKREEVVDFTQPFYATGLGIAVAKQSIFDWWRLLRSLISPGFWVALLGLLGITVLIGVIVWLLERRANEVFGRDPRAGIARGRLVVSLSFGAGEHRAQAGDRLWLDRRAALDGRVGDHDRGVHRRHHGAANRETTARLYT
jgi:polar amino acid transport system substrate-binding protein